MRDTPKNSEPSRREDIIRLVQDILAKAGFYLTDCTVFRSMTFDLIGRRDRELLFVKVLRNVDGFNRETAEEMKRITGALDGKPLIIGLHSGAGNLEDGIVYSRFDVPILTPGTLSDELLEGVPPFILAEPGGLYVRLDGPMLRRMREEMSLSLGALAEIAGVSRRAIQMYESGMKAVIDVAQRLEDFFDQPFVLPLADWDLKEPEEKSQEHIWRPDIDESQGFESEVYGLLTEIGYSVLPTRRSAFDAITVHGDDVVIAWLGQNLSEFRQKAPTLDSITRIAEKEAVIFLQSNTDKETAGGIPVINREELHTIQFPEELSAVAQQRRLRRRD